MKRRMESWTIADLRRKFAGIGFPEYQRKSTKWSQSAKQYLIDSITRQLDIGPIYLYEHNDGEVECIDGQQRIQAIASFMGINLHQADTILGTVQLMDNTFPLARPSDIADNATSPFDSLHGKKFDAIKLMEWELGNATASDFINNFLCYPLNVVIWSDSDGPDDFNLQFKRMDLGLLINGGMKLHAMVGDMRDKCFLVADNPFLEVCDIPTMRYAKEYLAAQLVAQCVSMHHSGNYANARHVDLQRLFKQNAHMDGYYLNTLFIRICQVLNLLHEAFEAPELLRNHAVMVSTVMLALKLGIDNPSDASKVARFVEEFLRRLWWQVRYGSENDTCYQYLFEFQRSLTYRSARKLSVDIRARIMHEEYEYWRKNHSLRGDAKYMDATGVEPNVESRKMLQSWRNYKVLDAAV